MQLRTTLIFTTATLALFAATPSLAGIKCWTNKEGVRECGNEVPPEFAQGRTETVNKRGMVTNVEERAKTAAEIAEEERKQGSDAANGADAERKKLDEEQKRQEQARYDRMIKASFLSEKDIEAARKRKLAAIDASIDLTNVTISKFEEKLKKQEQKAGKKPTADQQKDIDDLKKQIADKHAFIAIKQQEKADVNTEYDGYLNRFRELKGTKAP